MYPGYLSSSDRELSEKDEGIPSDQDISPEYLKYSVEYLKGGDINSPRNVPCTVQR